MQDRFEVLKVNNSRILYQLSPSIWTSEYYQYCVRLIIVSLNLIDKPVNIILGIGDYDFQNCNKTLKLDIQSEHTLVKLGGRSVDEIVWGDIDLINEDGKYLIRIPNYEYYSSLDATIEYSLPNIVNMGTDDRYSDYLETAIYIAPAIYSLSDFISDRRIHTSTMFSGNSSDRRSEFTSKVSDLVNIQGVFSKEDLKKIYHDTKILVNVHQTDHHHTFEELRILPALCNGVVVISEEVPLEEEIPYADSIVWSTYEDLPKTVKDVQENYDYYYKKIFTSELEDKIEQLGRDNIRNFVELIRKIG